MPKKESKLKGHKRTVDGVFYTYNITIDDTDTHSDLIRICKELVDKGFKTKVYYGKVGVPTGTKEKPTRIYVVKRPIGTPKRKKRQVDNITKWKAKVKSAIKRNHPHISVSSRKGEDVGNVLEGETKTKIFTAFFNKKDSDEYTISIFDYYPNTSDANYMKGKTFKKDANVNTVANFIVNNMGLRKKKSKKSKESTKTYAETWLNKYRGAGCKVLIGGAWVKGAVLDRIGERVKVSSPYGDRWYHYSIVKFF